MTLSIKDYIIKNIQTLSEMGFENDVCCCLEKGQNAAFLNKINAKYGFFKQIIPLEHPRFVMQHKTKFIQGYVHQYLEKLKWVKY